MAMLRSKLIGAEGARREEIAKEKGEAQDGPGIVQIRLTSSTRTRWSRTTARTWRPATSGVDGDLDEFVRAELLRRAGDGLADG